MWMFTVFFIHNAKVVLKRFQDIDEFKNPHFPCNFFVQTEFDDSLFIWKWKSGQKTFQSVRTSKVCNTLFKISSSSKTL